MVASCMCAARWSATSQCQQLLRTPRLARRPPRAHPATAQAASPARRVTTSSPSYIRTGAEYLRSAEYLIYRRLEGCLMGYRKWRAALATRTRILNPKPLLKVSSRTQQAIYPLSVWSPLAEQALKLLPRSARPSSKPSL